MTDTPSTTPADDGLPGDGDHRRHHLRRAEPHEAKELEELQTRSASHWDYPDGYFDWAGDARRVTESYVHDNPVLVLVDGDVDGDGDGRKLGFYSFTEDDDGDLLLDRMFLDVDQIGRGLGRLLWQHAVQTARDLGASEFVIGADPNAAPFYEAMGARWYAAKPTEEPTWTVQMYRYTLPGGA
jgi:GNAT superfamily N-acetyltransferase